MATISIGGLASGLDTNKIVDQLVALERRSVTLLENQRLEARAREVALQSFNSKVLAFLGAVDKLRTSTDVQVQKATSSDDDVLSAVAGSGATAGTATITVGALARGSIAVSANGTASASATVASGAGTFVFRLGSGSDQTVAVDGTTTLEGLASAINALDAGASAAVVNVGTAASPDFRLRLGSTGTGTSNDLTIVNDSTTLGVAVTQTAQNASFTVAGFTDPLVRETNTFDDVLPGVTLTLHTTGGPVTVSTAIDTEAVAEKVQAVVTAFNDLVNFVASESQVTQDTDSEEREVSLGPLAFDGTVRNVIESLRSLVSDPVEDLSGDFSLLAQIGVTTTREGTLAFNAGTLTAALASDQAGVGALFGGSGTVAGVADRLHDYLSGVTQAGGLIDVRSDGVAQQIRQLDEQIDAGERHLDGFEANLRAQFTNLEILVSSLQSQGSFLLSALGVGGKSS